MKHPVDTSTWGKFKLGDLFEFTGCKQVKSQHNLIETDKKNGIPFVVQSNANNMVKCYVTRESLIDNGETIYEGNTIMLGVMTPVSSYQEKEFGASQSISLRAPFLNPLRGLFMVAAIQAVIEPKYNYANIPGIQKYKEDVIPLPLKPSADPSNYDSTDIDWNYMETVMSRVMARAKERLANLPQPTDKQKTPVDTSAWGKFVIGELFELIGIKQVKSQHHVVEDPDGIPFVVQSNKNNMVKMKADKQWLLDNDEPVVEGNAIVLGVTLPVVSYQPYEFGASQVITARSEHLNELRGLFIASVINSFVIPKYSYVYKPGIQKYKQDVIPLPLKPSANPSNYTQEDIDWDYMENFMKTIEEKAHNRLKTLQKTIA